jgi:molecular chaperone DnaK
MIADARQAIEQQAGLDRVRPMIADLQQIIQALPASAAATAGAAGDGGGTAGATAGQAAGTAADDDEVVDAEFTRE